MSGGILSRARQLTDRLFPERQIFYRVGGEVVFIRLPKSLQLFSVMLLLLAGGWVVYSSAGLFYKDHVIATKDRQLAEVASAYNSLGQDLEEAEVRFLRIARDLETKHARLVQLIQTKSALERKLSQISRELDGAVAERDKNANLKQALTQRLANLENSLQVALEAPADGADGGARERPAPGNAEGKLETLIAARDTAVRGRQDMANKVDHLEGRVATLSSVETRLQHLIAERDQATRIGEQMASKVRHLEDRLDTLQKSQHELVARVHEHTITNLDEVEAMIALTGLDADDLLKVTAPREGGSGLGGPFIVPPDNSALVWDFTGEESDFEGKVVRLEIVLNRWAELQLVLQRLPMTSPLDTYYVASRFGKRRDPFSRRWAMHYGLDLAGPKKAPVWSTAPGKVTFVGRKGPYGRLVEIDHGYGIKTRYGHLYKILVSRGDEIGFRHKIGLMGSTGRSTGTHVHYEILYNDKPQNPADFMKAGKYVFKG